MPVRARASFLLEQARVAILLRNQHKAQQMYLSWAAGYVSGANMLDQSDARLTGASWSPASFLLWLKNYCSVHDLDPFVKAVGELRRSFAVKEGLISR